MSANHVHVRVQSDSRDEISNGLQPLSTCSTPEYPAGHCTCELSALSCLCAAQAASFSSRPRISCRMNAGSTVDGSASTAGAAVGLASSDIMLRRRAGNGSYM
eukprot:5777346-Pleurochrysis_carterae.AAC.3